MPLITDVGSNITYFNPKNVQALVHSVTLDDDTIGIVTIYDTSEDGGSQSSSYNVSAGDDFDTIVAAIRNTQDPNALMPIFTQYSTGKDVWFNPRNIDHVIDASTWRQVDLGHGVSLNVTGSFAAVTDPLLIWENWAR